MRCQKQHTRSSLVFPVVSTHLWEFEMYPHVDKWKSNVYSVRYNLVSCFGSLSLWFLADLKFKDTSNSMYHCYH